jgi:hypothetical protein
MDRVIDPPVAAQRQPVDVRPVPRDTPAGAVPFQAAKWSRLGNRNTWRASPVTVPAITGPAPNRPVRLVPEARTAAASFLWVSRSWAPGRRMPARNSAAGSQRALVAASDGLNLLEDVGGPAGADLPAHPAGHRSQSTACSRQAAWLRKRAKSRCLFAHTFTTAWSSAITGRVTLERSAATATEKASFGSFWLVFPDCSSRTRAASLGGTSSTCSPAAASCCASRFPSPAAPSIAQARSGHSCAHASSRPA